VNYVVDAYYEVTDKTLNKITCNNKTLRAILEEIFGYVMFRRNELGKAVILTGNGSNGKSAFLKMLRVFIGELNTSSVDLKDLGGRFKTSELVGKLANIGDDISNEYIKDNSQFKKLVTGESLNVERKGKDPFDFKSYAKLIFSANNTPRINDHSNGLLRRLLFIPFNAKFTPDDPDFDPFISDKLESQQSMEYVLQLGLAGLKRLLENNRFTKSKVSDAELERYNETNNPLLGWLNEEDPKLINERTKDCWNDYNKWCFENGNKSLGQISFSREVCRIKNLTTKARKVRGIKNQFFIEITK
jgi:putative DNA primase/helicase